MGAKAMQMRTMPVTYTTLERAVMLRLFQSPASLGEIGRLGRFTDAIRTAANLSKRGLVGFAEGRYFAVEVVH